MTTCCVTMKKPFDQHFLPEPVFRDGQLGNSYTKSILRIAEAFKVLKTCTMCHRSCTARVRCVFLLSFRHAKEILQGRGQDLLVVKVIVVNLGHCLLIYTVLYKTSHNWKVKADTGSMQAEGIHRYLFSCLAKTMAHGVAVAVSQDPRILALFSRLCTIPL